MENKASQTSFKDAVLAYAREHRVVSVIALLFVALVLYRAGRFFIGAEPEPEELPVNVVVTEASLQPIDVVSPVTGRLQPSEEVALVPMATGKVKAVYVRTGDRVSAGQILFEIDSGQVASSVNQAKASFDAVASTFARMEMLYKEGAVSLQDYESAQAQYTAARESYRAAAEAYANFTVTSPIDGIVTSLHVTAGSVAGGQAAGSVATTNELVIETTVNEALVPSLETGAVVQVYIDRLEEEYQGIITSFSPIPSIGMLTYPLTITMEPDEALFAGMFAEVRLVSQNIPEALCVPSEAVIIRDGRSVVVVLEGDVPSIREVVPGVDNGEIVQIVSGLNEGDVVVKSGQHFVVPGVPVRIVSEAS